LGKPQNIEIDEMENGAHEENDNDFKIEDKRSNLDDVFDPENANIVNNAAEEFDAHNKPIDKKSRNDEMDLEIINRPGGNGVKDKLNDEIAGDHGKEPDGYPEMEDLHIEGQQEENDDLGDGKDKLKCLKVHLTLLDLTLLPFLVGEYDDPKAIKQGGVAERN
jgi:hypothetical protein